MAAGTTAPPPPLALAIVPPVKGRIRAQVEEAEALLPGAALNQKTVALSLPAMVRKYNIFMLTW